jgi:hypothetical protein
MAVFVNNRTVGAADCAIIAPMSAESGPTPTPDAEPPGSAESENNKHVENTEPQTKSSREPDPTTRSARYALITAVAAAVISSFVAAGSAVYVSIHQSDRAERQAAAQAVRTDRQKVYSDFSISLFKYTDQLAAVDGMLQAHSPIESVRAALGDLNQRQSEFLAGLNLLLMAGSPQMQDVGAQFANAIAEFGGAHLRPFMLSYVRIDAPAANDVAAWQRDSSALASEMDKLLVKIGDLNGAFVEQGSRQLR